MAENNSKAFIIGIIIFVLLVIGGFAFFAGKDVSVEQEPAEVAVPAPEGVVAPSPFPAPADEPDAAEPVFAPVPEPTEPAGDPTPIPTPADEPAAETDADEVQ